VYYRVVISSLIYAACVILPYNPRGYRDSKYILLSHGTRDIVYKCYKCPDISEHAVN